jgi:hypothetical protein
MGPWWCGSPMTCWRDEAGAVKAPAPMSKARMPRQILSIEQLRDLDQALIAVYAQFTQLRERHPAAQQISRPGIPSIFSESLVAHASPLLFGKGARGQLAGPDADLRVSAPEIPDRLAEVKERDLQRDLFIWVAFGHRYEKGSGAIDIYVLGEPTSYLPPRRKITLGVFLAGVENLDCFRAISFSDIEEMLNG